MVFGSLCVFRFHYIYMQSNNVWIICLLPFFSCDYVIYPLQDPAISQQEYLDAKQGSIIAAMAQSPAIPPQYLAIHANHSPWDYKGHAIYRSTPYLSMAYSAHSHYASTQNLSDTYVQLPSGAYSPLYSPSIASLCSSYDAPPPVPLRPRPMTTTPSMFARSKSDDNILNSFDLMPKAKRLPPPPPPYPKKSLKPPMPPPIDEATTATTTTMTSSMNPSNMIANNNISTRKFF